jgi:tyrosine-protein kinase Etk/Wzc
VALDLGLHVVGVVPNLRVLATNSIDDKERSLSVWTAVESFRGLRTQLMQGLRLQYPAVVAVTSPAPGDGKSLVAANLATSFAEPRRPTLIIDGDMRRGILHKTFRTRSNPGLSEYLRGEAKLGDIITMAEASSLSVIPRGSLARSAPELLDSDVFTELVAQLRQHFKVIIFDTPPLVGGVDGLLIGRHSSAVVAVLRAGQTTLDLARARLEHYTQALQVPIVAVLNDVPAEGRYGYSKYVYTHYASPRE